MDVILPERTFAEKQFTVQGPRAKVWDLLAMVTYQELPLEQVDIVGLDRFRALLRWKAGLIRFPMHVEGRLVDTLRPESYGCVLSVARGPIRMDVRVTIKLKATDQGQTEVSCSAMQEGKETLTGLLLKGMQRNFARKMFDSIGEKIQRLCASL